MAITTIANRKLYLIIETTVLFSGKPIKDKVIFQSRDNAKVLKNIRKLKGLSDV